VTARHDTGVTSRPHSARSWPRLLLLLAIVGLLVPPAAFAGSREKILRDCQDGHIDGQYTQKQYADALANIPTDVDEYTDCRDVIRRSQLSSAGKPSGGGGGSGGGGASGGSTGSAGSSRDPLATASRHERATFERQRAQPDKAVTVRGRLVQPGSLGYEAGGSLSEIPTPLLVALILLGAGAVAAGGMWLRTRVNPRRTP
jgi:hypothetical protein